MIALGYPKANNNTFAFSDKKDTRYRDRGSKMIKDLL